jgi:hypothetical protein
VRIRQGRVCEGKGRALRVGVTIGRVLQVRMRLGRVYRRKGRALRVRV